MAAYVKANPMKGFGKSSLDMWLGLYDEFLDQRDKEHFDKVAAERAKAKKRQDEIDRQ